MSSLTGRIRSGRRFGWTFVAKKTKADGDLLMQRIDALVAELDSVGAGMGASPTKK